LEVVEAEALHQFQVVMEVLLHFLLYPLMEEVVEAEAAEILQVFQEDLEAQEEAEAEELKSAEQEISLQLVLLKEIQAVLQDQAHPHNTTMAEVVEEPHKQELEEFAEKLETAVMVEQLVSLVLQYQKQEAAVVELKVPLPQELLQELVE
jgi:hypothetical protein